MKKKDQKLITKTLEKIQSITRHIRNVEDNCLILGTHLINNGEVEIGKNLIANGFVHDSSKFFGIEWDNLHPGQTTKEDESKLKLKLAISHHANTQNHHAEKWNGIKNMPRVYLAEFTCDIKSRSQELGTDLRNWIDEEATKRYDFNKEDKVYKEIMEFVDVLCPKPFENLNN